MKKARHSGIVDMTGAWGKGAVDFNFVPKLFYLHDI
jgi:hypothetical protein